MTSPLTQGGQPFTIGQAPQLLTEYAAGPDAPVLIVNTSTSLAWVAGHSGVGPSNGVPVEPGTAVPWTSPGQIWAIADPAATGSITVVLTGAVSDWSPSPATIGAEVATQLLAGGVPQVYQSTLVANTFYNSGTKFDVHEYAAVQVSLHQLGGSGYLSAEYQFIDSASGFVVEQGLLSCDYQSSGAAPGQWPTWTLPVVAGQLRFSNSNANVVVIIGNNRVSNKKMNYDFDPFRQFNVTIPSGTASLTRTQCVDALTTTAGLTNLTSYNGPIVIQWNVSNLGGASSLQLQAQYRDYSGALHSTIVAQTSSAGLQTINVGHPFAFTSWWIENVGATTAGVAQSLFIVPNYTPV